MRHVRGPIAALSLSIFAFTSHASHADEKPAPAPTDPQVAALLAGLAELPPEAKPGECYLRVRLPAQFETSEERLLVKPEAIRYEVVPPEFKDVEKEIVIKPESITYEVVPAQYETKEVEVVLAPEFTKINATEPVFQPEDNKIETRAARLALKLDVNPFSSVGPQHAEVLSLSNDPAEIKAYTRNLLIKPAQVQQEKVPRAIEKVATQVLVKPAEVKEVKVPAEVKKVLVRELVRPATKKELKLPAEYTIVTRQRLVAPEKIVWQRVLCTAEMTPAMITNIQTKLKEKGVDPGELNGQLTDPTKAAVTQYQTQNNLAQGGLTYEFLKHIGIQP
jgi:hypothetical protein